jgi:hypothetical protein
MQAATMRGAILHWRLDRPRSWRFAMATQSLRLASQPTQVDSLLDSLIVSQQYVPDAAQRIRFRDELPLRLQLRARQVRDGVWRAWTDGLCIWFVAAKLIPEVSREVSRHALHVSFIDMDGRLASSAVWTLNSDGRWILYDANPQHRC